MVVCGDGHIFRDAKYAHAEIGTVVDVDVGYGGAVRGKHQLENSTIIEAPKEYVPLLPPTEGATWKWDKAFRGILEAGN